MKLLMSNVDELGRKPQMFLHRDFGGFISSKES